MPLQHLFGCATVFHLSWNQHACEGLWFHEKWNTVCAQALSNTSSGAQPCSTCHGTRDSFVPKPCPIFHVTKPLARCAGSMKSGTRFCAQSNFRRPHKKRICFGSGRAESASVLRAIARPNIADMRSRNFCATAREADMRSRNLRDHSQSRCVFCAVSENCFARRTSFHFSRNQRIWPVVWLREKWDTVVHKRVSGSMKSGTRLCARGGVGESLCANRVPLFMEPKPFAGMLVP